MYVGYLTGLRGETASGLSVCVSRGLKPIPTVNRAPAGIRKRAAFAKECRWNSGVRFLHSFNSGRAGITQ